MGKTIWVQVTCMGGPRDGEKADAFGCPPVLGLSARDPEKGNEYRVALYDRITDSPIYRFRGWEE